MYRTYITRMMEECERFPNYRIVKFEDFLEDPFGQVNGLLEFANMEPKTLSKLLVKSRKVLRSSGSFEKPEMGTEGRKYWIDEQRISEFLFKDASQVQKSALSREDRNAFEKEAKPILEHFGY